MAHELPALPYDKTALQPEISSNTLDFHHGKHHNAYVTNLNNLIKDTDNANASLEDIIKKAPAGGLFNNAAQVWNHTFYWNSMSPTKGQTPSGALAAAIDKKWGSFDKFKEEFKAKAVGTFGSGWAWLVKTADGGVDIETTTGAGTPITGANKPLITCDVWEHAYYLDYQNLRPAYVDAWFNIANWAFAEKNFA